jgi:hypothetical protein
MKRGPWPALRYYAPLRSQRAKQLRRGVSFWWSSCLLFCCPGASPARMRELCSSVTRIASAAFSNRSKSCAFCCPLAVLPRGLALFYRASIASADVANRHPAGVGTAGKVMDSCRAGGAASGAHTLRSSCFVASAKRRACRAIETRAILPQRIFGVFRALARFSAPLSALIWRATALAV